MKRIIIALSMLTLTMGLYAQQGNQRNNCRQRGERMEPNRQANRAAQLKNLNLSESQKTEMKRLQQQFRQQQAELNKNESITVKEQRDARFEMAKNQRNKMKALLTPEQQQQLKTNQEKATANRKLQQGKRFEEMANSLNLNESQRAQLEKERESARLKVEALKQNENHSRADVEQTLKQVRENHSKTMKEVLTPEQYEQWKSMEKGRQGRRPKPAHGESSNFL